MGLFVICLAVLPAANATDRSGTWKGAFEFDGNNVALTLHLTIAGGAVTGTVEGLPTTPAEIHDGKVDGDMMTFWLNTDYEGETYKLVYKGTISTDGNEIAFTFGTEDGSWSTQMTAAKSAEAAPAAEPQVADVTGTWKGAFDLNGSSMPLTFHLTSAAGGTVTGTVDAPAMTLAEIHGGKVDGDTITFWISADYQGQTYKLLYKGKIAAGQIEFTFGTEDGSWSAQLTATKGA
jgi:riboflavin synthase alpha subunit